MKERNYVLESHEKAKVYGVKFYRSFIFFVLGMVIFCIGFGIELPVILSGGIFIAITGIVALIYYGKKEAAMSEEMLTASTQEMEDLQNDLDLIELSPIG